MSKLGTDGSAVYGYIDAKLAWIPVSKLDATKPTVTTYYANIGTAVITTATTNGEVTAYKTASTSSDVAFKIANDIKVGISEVDYISGNVWGKVVVDATTEGWINLSGTTFALTVKPAAEINVFTTTDKTAFLYDSVDETLKITCGTGDTLTVRSLTFDSTGNVWAMIVQNTDVLNGNWVIIRNGDGTMNVNYA